MWQSILSLFRNKHKMQGEIPKYRRVLIDRTDFENNQDFLKAARKILNLDASTNIQIGEEEVLKFEKQHDVILPNGLRDYFKIINGVNDAEWITNLYCLDEITHISKHFWFEEDDLYKTEQYRNFYIIGDIMINSHQWAMILSKDGLNESIIEMDTESKITDDIFEFIEMFINESPYSLVK